MKLNSCFTANQIDYGLDLSQYGKGKEKKLDRVNGDIVIVEGAVVDYDEEIQSHKKEAGLEAIKKAQILRYGTLDNAIARNQAKQKFLDVSKLGDDIANREIAKANEADIAKLAAKLGISKEEILTLTKANFEALVKAKESANDNSANDNSANGGANNEE